MRKILFKLTCFVFMIGMLIPFNSKASHFVGGEITYQYTGVSNTYIIRFKFYRDCSGITPPASIPLCYSSDSCGVSGTIDLFPIPGTGNPIPPSPCVPVVATTCNGGTAYGVEEHIYEATLVLPLACHDWKFSYEECCRNGVSTLQGGPGLYLDAYLNNLVNPTNSSPYFTTIPVTEFCINNQFYFDQGALDIDGDSLVYSLMNAQDASFGCPFLPFDVTYLPPYSGLNPLATLNGTTIDPLTGIISFTPTTIQTAVIAVRCTEYDRTTLQVKSTIKREIQINIVSTCIIATPGFDSTLTTTGINIVVDGISNVACDDSVFFITLSIPVQCGSIVPSDIRFIDANGVSNPVATALPWNCVNGLTDSIRVTLINPIALGTSYIFTKIGFDGNTFLSECGSPMNEFDTLAITLTDSSTYYFQIADTVDCAFTSLVLNSNQQISCNEMAADGSDFILVDANGDTIPIVSAVCNGLLPGGLFNNQFTLNVAASTGAVGPLTLLVKQGTDGNTFSNACKNFILQNDTVGQIQLRNNIAVNLGNDITACSSDPTPQLFAGLLPPYINYSWTLDNNPTAGDTATISAGVSGTYIVTASASASCQGSDTVVVNILPSPIVTLGNDITLCSGASFPQLDAGNTGASFQWYLNGTALTNDTLEFYTPLAAGSYQVTVNVGANCFGRDTVDINVAAQLNVSVSDLALCAGTSTSLQSTSPNSGVAYQWTLNGTVIPNETGMSIPVNQTGTYGVVISLSSGGVSCSASDSATVTAINQPTANLSDITQCDNFPTLDPGYPANTTFGTTYAWTLGGNAAGNGPTLVTSANGNYAVTITNTFGGVNCTATASMNLTVNTTPTNVDVTGDSTICTNTPGASSVTLTVNATNGTTYQWSVGGNIITGATNNTYTATSTGVYTAEVTGTGNCRASAAGNVVIGINPDITVQDSTDNNQDSVLFCKGQGIPLLSVVNPQTGYTYNWSYNGFSSADPVIVVDAIGNYSVIVTNAAGCTGTDDIYVVPGVCDVNPPNVFTPNGDGKNDFFEIPNLLDYQTRKLTVYNRWGNEVYSADKYSNDWNGGDLEGGTYFYVLELYNGIQSSTKNGYLQIIK